VEPLLPASSYGKIGNADLATSSSVAGNQTAAFVQAPRIRGFDGLRAIAFLLVFVSHKVYFAHADSFGDVGVWLFFALSGFLITRILARSRSEIEDGLATVRGCLGRFYLRRTARIFPPYYLLIGFFVVASFFVSIDYFGTAEKLAYLLYGTNLLIAARSQWIGDFGHFWSLAVEEQFYLVFAPLILLVPRRHTINVCLAMILTGVVTKIVLEIEGASAISIDVNSLINFALIGFGGVVGLNAYRAAPKWLAGGAAQVAVLGVYLALPAAFGTWHHVWPLLGKLSAVLAGLLLFQIFRGQRSWFVIILESAPLRNIGRISYGAYLIHHFLHFSAIGNLLPQLGAGLAPRFIQVIVELAASLMIAGLSWHYLERPIIAWAARVTSRRTEKSADSAAAPEFDAVPAGVDGASRDRGR
jgi:peptidoglycan/LPS O-acetylase OafA/YrhL